MKYTVIINPQNDFISATGPFGSMDAEAVETNIIKKILTLKDDNNMTFLTVQDTHDEMFFGTAEGQNCPLKHCILGTEGWEISPTILKALGEPKDPICVEPFCYLNKIYKETFGSLDLVNLLYHLDDTSPTRVEAINLMGYRLDISVLSNALMLKAAFPEIPITVFADCCLGSTPELQEMALCILKANHINIK